MISVEDLKTYQAIGKGLWIDLAVSERSAVETLSASLLLSLDPGQTLEKAAAALLDRARRSEGRENSTFNIDFISNSFFRLNIEERFILACLHGGHWSYARIGRILKMTRDQVEEKAWAARLKMAVATSSRLYPAGPSQRGFTCPEYFSKRPWTQVLLDDELGSRSEKIALEQHLPACSSCAQSLKRCRELYFELDQKINVTLDRGDFVSSLERVLVQGKRLLRRTGPSFLKGFLSLTKRRDIQVILLAWLGIMIAEFFR